MTEPFFGLIFPQVSDDPLPPVLSDFTVFGLVLPSDDANPVTFPLNTPVAVNTGDTTMLAAMGTGPIYKAVLRINAQLADLQVSARGVIVRVATGRNQDGTENVAQTIANILGNQAQGTGIYALLKAPTLCSLTPRLLGVPGYTGICQRQGGTQGVTATPKVGNTGNGLLTLASTALGNAAEIGTYKVKCIGGGFTATAAPRQGIVGNGTVTMGSPSTDNTAIAGRYLATCIAVSANSGEFLIQDPTGQVIGVATVGNAFTNGIHFTINDGSTDFANGDQIAFTSTAVVPANGGAFSVTAPDNTIVGTATVGTAFASAHVNFTIADGSTDFVLADEFDLAVTATGGQLLANPIATALPMIASRLLAHNLIGGPGSLTRQDVYDWRTTINDQRTIPEDAWEIVSTVDGLSTEFIDGVATSIGLQIRVDFLHEGLPYWSIANRAIQGALGVKRVDDYSLFDGATNAQEMLAGGIGVTVKGDLSDGALDDSGLVKIVLNCATSNTLFNIYSKNRGRDFETLALAKSIRHRLGVENVTLTGVQAVLNDMKALFVLLKSKGGPLGYSIGFKSTDNTVEGLRAGQFTVYGNSEQSAPIIQITVKRGLDEAAVVNELAQLVTDVSSDVSTS